MRKVIELTVGRLTTLALVLALGTGLAGLGGCAAGKALGPVAMEPLPLERAAPAALERNHFQRDRSGSITEEGLREVLAAPVFLEPNARVGVIQVASGYEPDAGLPVVDVPAGLTEALEKSGMFEVATEVSSDWPADSGVSGLRELAARYRVEYLLLYRHRFVDETWTNGWGWMYMLVLPAFFVPSQTTETAGVMEATLFDVKTGTILYTVFERVKARDEFNVWHNEQKLRGMQEKLMRDTADALSRAVVSKTRFLVASRPRPEAARPAPAVAAPAPEPPVVTPAEPAPAEPVPSES
ncbi:MAG TPA: hypothetical protein PK668_10535 [Myxococcota bacterium]|nr:hypothetical protein [Myxococcota bacterium]HRY93401.1 hypothetical protein [Myxococcota bacterium]HSA23436.1 hypothetical protein [Myxococcota bacterium]